MFKSKLGIAQIPVLIGLLIMAIALPVASTLVKQTQDTRGEAATTVKKSCDRCSENYGCTYVRFETYESDCATASPIPGTASYQANCLCGPKYGAGGGNDDNCKANNCCASDSDCSGKVAKYCDTVTRKCSYGTFACQKSDAYDASKNCNIVLSETGYFGQVCNGSNVYCYGEKNTCSSDLGCSKCATVGGQCCTATDNTKFCHNGLSCGNNGTCVEATSQDIWYYCGSAGCTTGLGSSNGKYNTEYECKQLSGATKCYKNDSACGKQCVIPTSTPTPTSTSTPTPTPPSSAWYINNLDCDHNLGSYNCTYGTVPSGKVSYTTENLCKQGDGKCYIWYERTTECVNGKYKCIATFRDMGSTTLYKSGNSEQNRIACEGTCTPPPQKKYFINRNYQDRGCDHGSGKYNCTFGEVPSGEIGYDTQVLCENATGCDYKYARVNNGCVNSGNGTGKYLCEINHYGTFNSMTDCEAVGSCVLEKYWTHQGNACSATGKWQCVTTATSTTFTSQSACENDANCPVSYSRSYCDSSTGNWVCSYSIVPFKSGDILFTDENDTTALNKCQNSSGCEIAPINPSQCTTYDGIKINSGAFGCSTYQHLNKCNNGYWSSNAGEVSLCTGSKKCINNQCVDVFCPGAEGNVAAGSSGCRTSSARAICMVNASGNAVWGADIPCASGVCKNGACEGEALKCSKCANNMDRAKGDADCDGKITLNDWAIWLKEFETGKGTEVRTNWLADFDCDGKVTGDELGDLNIWFSSYLEYQSK